MFLYSEGAAAVLLNLIWGAPISKYWMIPAVLLVLPRFNHAGWAVVGWFRSVIDFHRVKEAEMERLQTSEGSKENMEKMDLLRRTYATSIIPVIVFLVTSVLIPLIVSMLPKMMNW